MDLLDRLLAHDAWTTSQLLLLAQGLTDEQLDREFDLGPRTVRATLGHMIRNVEIWSALMEAASSSGTPTPPPESPPGSSPGLSPDIEAISSAHLGSIESLIARHEIAAARLERVARQIAARDGWDETWLDRLDDPPREKTYGGAIAHVITHSTHHRGQVLFMLRRLGVANVPEGDVLSWEQQLGA